MPTDIIAPMMIYVRTMPLIDFFDYRCYRIWYVDYFCEREFLILSLTKIINENIGKQKLMPLNTQTREIIDNDKSRELLFDALTNHKKRTVELFLKEKDPFLPYTIKHNSEKIIETLTDLINKINTNDGNVFETNVENNMKLIQESIWRYREDLVNAKNHINDKKMSAILLSKIEESLSVLEDMDRIFKNAIKSQI